MNKIDQIKEMISSLGKVSLLIWGQHLWSLKCYGIVPEIEFKLNPNGSMYASDSIQISRERYSFLKKRGEKIINELWDYTNEVYGKKLYAGISGANSTWYHGALENHLSGKEFAKYTSYDKETKSFNLNLPDDVIIHTTWS